MSLSAKTAEQRLNHQLLSPEELAAYQLRRFNHLIEQILPENKFYKRHLREFDLPLQSLDDLASLPYTFKDHLIDESGRSDFAANLTFDPSEYCRFHRTSGTRGRPMTVLDTADDWAWWTNTWQFVLDSAELLTEDRVLMAFSFGPFIGFWSAFDAVAARGALCIPSGGLTTLARLEMIQSTSSNVLFCTPSYALHMAQTASENQINVGQLPIDRIVVAGEPGGSVPAIRECIESQWQARVIDHSGASEVGPWGFADPAAKGLYVNESEFVAEFLSVEHGGAANAGELSELVLTNLGRFGSPVIRYRTGDLVRPSWNDDQRCNFVLLEGGVLGRSDDMMIVRGVNIFPSSIEQILRSFPEVIEYRMTAFKEGQMDQLKIEIEDRLNQPQRVANELQVRLALRVEIECVPTGTLPRFDLKGKRFVDLRKTKNQE